MKIICTQENLSKGLQLVSHIASKNISLPILSNVLLKAEKSGITLMTTNLEIGITCRVRGKVEAEGSITLPAKTLSDYVNLLPKEKITISQTNSDVKVESGKSSTVIKGVDPSEFPLIPEVTEGDQINLSKSILKNGLVSVMTAVAVDETRPEINGAYLAIVDNELILAATDSYRLAEKKIPLQQAAAAAAIIIPLKTAQELVRILSNDDTGEITMRHNENQALFNLGEAEITSRLIEGQYPDYKQIIPEQFATRAVIPTESFINTIKQAGLFCKQGGNDVVVAFKPEEKEITVSAANVQIGESTARQDADIEGDASEIVFNYRFLLDGLQHITDESTFFEINGATSPGLLKPAQDETYKYIIMPIKQ